MKPIRPENETFDYTISVQEEATRPYTVHKMRKHRVRGKWYKELWLSIQELLKGGEDK